MIRRFFANPATGELVVVQWPNLALWIFLAASVVGRLLRPDGVLGTAVVVVATASLAWWSIDEIARGESPFRRVLGAVVLAVLVVLVVGLV